MADIDFKPDPNFKPSGSAEIDFTPDPSFQPTGTQPSVVAPVTRPSPIGIQEYFNLPVTPDLAQSVQTWQQQRAASQPGFIETGKPTVLPTTLSMAGGLLGTTVAGPAGGVIGRAGGSVAGEYLNQRFGLTPESTAQLGLAGGASIIGDVGPTLLRRLGLSLPGSAAALRQYGQETAEKIPGQVLPPVPAATLF